MWLNLFNNKSTLKQAKKIIEVVEENFEAEILMDKIKGIEHKYERIETYKQRYKVLVYELVYDFNYRYAEKYSDISKINIQENVPQLYGFDGGLQQPTFIIISNAYYNIKEEITPQMKMLQMEDIAYEKLYKQINMRGMIAMFAKNVALPIMKAVEEFSGFQQEGETIQERSFNIENFNLKQLDYQLEKTL